MFSAVQMSLMWLNEERLNGYRRQLESLCHRWEDNIKMDLKETF